MELEHRLRTALDESRLLILGAQVLFAFQFQAVFQDLFQSILWDGKLDQCGGLLLLLVAVGLLITPSLLLQRRQGMGMSLALQVSRLEPTAPRPVDFRRQFVLAKLPAVRSRGPGDLRSIDPLR